MNLDEVWKSVKGDLQVSLPKGQFNTFITQMNLVELRKEAGKTIGIIDAIDLFRQQMAEKKCGKQIQEALTRVIGENAEVKIIHSGNKKTDSKNKWGNYGPLFSHQEEDQLSYNRAVEIAGLRPDFTFERFAVSSPNEMAYAAAQAVSKNPGKMYQLLFLFGGVGVGKTHLMQAIGHRILERNPDYKIIYSSGEEFTNEIIEAIQYKTTAEFRKKHRSVKALLIDDIQFIGGKDKVQEEFFHTFNAIQRAGGQVVLTSDQMPNEITGVEDRLRSRFEGGLTIDIQQPNFELRTAILLIKAKNSGLNLPMDVAQLVAANIESTRGLEGFLTRLFVQSNLKNEPITIEMAQTVLGSANKNGKQEDSVFRYDPSTMLSTVANVFSVKVSQLKGERRKKELVLPRHVAMYLMRTDLRASLAATGSLLGGRDHTTVIHAVDKITAELPNDGRLRAALEEIRKRLKMTGG